jgi:hypothetical protein
MVESRRSFARPTTAVTLALLVLVASLLLSTGAAPAPAASIVAKDGKIHACYKAKGKGKGTLRVVRNRKVKCPKRWKKVAWDATGQFGPAGPTGEPGSRGDTATPGERGTAAGPTPASAASVTQLQDKVTELLTKVQSLESILAGINNQQLKEAIAKVPVVDALCTQAKSLNEQSGALGTSLGALVTVVDALTLAGVPAVPVALPAFECP